MDYLYHLGVDTFRNKMAGGRLRLPSASRVCGGLAELCLGWVTPNNRCPALGAACRGEDVKRPQRAVASTTCQLLPMLLPTGEEPVPITPTAARGGGPLVHLAGREGKALRGEFMRPAHPFAISMDRQMSGLAK